jgi:hypothetical protein
MINTIAQDSYNSYASIGQTARSVNIRSKADIISITHNRENLPDDTQSKQKLLVRNTEEIVNKNSRRGSITNIIKFSYLCIFNNKLASGTKHPVRPDYRIT